MTSLSSSDLQIRSSDAGLEPQTAGNRAAIIVEKMNVHYQRPKNQAASFKEFTIRLLKRQTGSKVIKALNDISLEIYQGEVYGIIGRNGAGKSTLLKVLSRIIRPTQGRIQIWGKISPLLGVGAGFHPELTGRENIYLYSSLLGRTMDRTRELFDEIVDFAELSEFIEMPNRIYSTGMTARLGFAVAMAERPEVLLVDEVLSVGDEQFKDKCKKRFEEFQKSGTTIVFVSHSMPVVKEFCSRASWLHKGALMATGKTEEIVKQYWESINKER